MINEEQLNAEKNRLSDVYAQICSEIKSCGEKIEEAEEELRNHFVYKDENIYSMDTEEETSSDLFYENLQLAVDVLKRRLQILKQLKKSAYFGSFKFTSENGFNNVYVGTTGFIGKGSYPLICDWRAPISSMFYDYEIGEASYTCKEGTFKGEILGKRQFKVKEDEIVYAFDSDLTIGDEILKMELASSGDKMKNIVATIQKEQNLIIREPNFKNMLVQGVAGSGKTSIALHRAAYLLYSMRDQLKADDILVISISDLFSKYIENVLPELGENMVKSITFSGLAHSELSGFVLETNDEMCERINSCEHELNDYIYKNSFEYLDNLKKFLKDNDQSFFTAKDIKLGEETFSAESISNLYFQKFNRITPAERISNICDYVCEILSVPETAKERVLTLLFSMFNFDNIYKILIKFHENDEKINEKTQIIAKNNKILINHDDLATVLYLANYFYGLEKRNDIKLLIVDEFQEYSPLHFELLKEITDCVWIVLGDINQAIYKNLDEKYLENLSQKFQLGDIIYLNKSYRMTNQIAKVANKTKNVQSENFDRNGEEVEIVSEQNLENDLTEILNKSKFENKAILVKDNARAEEIYNLISKNFDCTLNRFEGGKILVASINYVKGIEFEHVIIPDVTKENYASETDKNILYNLVTRATNKLTIISNGYNI